LAKRRGEERELDGELSKIEVRVAQLQSKRDFLVEKVQGDYGLGIGGIDWKKELWEADREFKRVNLDEIEEGETIEAEPKEAERDPFPAELEPYESTDWGPIQREIKELRERLGSMGPVNLVAIEEYADLRQRYNFLKEQSDDLWQSKDELVKAIDELNETSQTLFADTFAQIRKNFEYTYDQLTGGGFADLELADTDDPLDSGIEITARPPGTRLKSLSLLSGGQKTMTAVALLFAIYMVKPSPFCVLDELDAPLDDANIGRFTDMLKQFTKFSQFLIITHNKRTIAAADAIFGVTMPEKGVSKLLSMRLNQATGRAETEAGRAISTE
jgi:chromosome segregation protein